MRSIPLVAVFALVLAACDASDPAPTPVPLNVQTATDVEADPTTGRDPDTGAPISNNLFTLYDLDANEVVLSSDETDPAVRAADSASTAWDIGFRGTTIIVNGGASGPGAGEAQLLTEAFAEVNEAPEDGYVADGENDCPAVETPGGTFPGAPYAICTGSGNGWYDYNPQLNLISPIPGRTIVLTTADGQRYAKVRILSFYRGNPNPPDPQAPSRHYTFEYVVQPDGSRDFETTAAD